MGLAEINTVADPVKKKGGMGGLIGSIAGGALGVGALAAAPFTGGTSLAFLPAALGVGAALGPLAGNMIDPVKQSGGGTDAPVQQMNGAPSKLNVMADIPEVQFATIQHAKSLIPGSKMPQDEAENAMKMLNGAQQSLTSRMKGFTPNG